MLQKRILNILIIIEVVILIIILIFGIFNSGEGVSSYIKDIFEKETTTISEETEIEGEEEPESFFVISDDVQEKIDEMSIEEKVAQMFIITPEALTEVGTVIRAGETSRRSIEEFPAGGLVFSGENLTGITQSQDMLSGFQEFSIDRTGLELFLIIEEEGGENFSPVAGINVYEEEGSPYSLGLEEDFDAVSNHADNISLGIKELGFNTNLAPMSDIASGFEEDYDERTFGNNSGVVSLYVSEEVKKFKENNVYSIMKYFPGKSYAIYEDGVYVNERTIEELRENEFQIYKNGINAGAEMIMLSNVVSFAINNDSETLCSLSSATVNILRNELNFNGIIITDNLSDEGITDVHSAGEAAIKAILAGVDMIYLPSDYEAAYQSILEAIESGEIDESLINDAVAHILTVKMND